MVLQLAYAYGFQIIIFTLLLFYVVLGHTSFTHAFFPEWLARASDWVAQPILFYAILLFSLAYPALALVYAAVRLRRHWRFRSLPIAIGAIAVTGTVAIVFQQSKEYLFLVTNVTPGSEAVTVLSLGASVAI